MKALHQADKATERDVRARHNHAHSRQISKISETYTVTSFTEVWSHLLKGRNATYLLSETFPWIH